MRRPVHPYYEISLKLWEGLEQDLNYNAMVSQRGILNLIHSDNQRDAIVRRGNAMLLHGADAKYLSREQLQAELPFLNYDNARFPPKVVIGWDRFRPLQPPMLQSDCDLSTLK